VGNELLSASLVDEVAAIAAALIGLALASIARNLQKVQKPQDAAVCAGLLFALLFGAKLAFLHWLCVDAAGSLTAMEFSWFSPFTWGVIWIGGSAVTAFLAAILARPKE